MDRTIYPLVRTRYTRSNFNYLLNLKSNKQREERTLRFQIPFHCVKSSSPPAPWWWGSCKSVAARRKDSGESFPSVDKITSLTRRTWSNSSFGIRHFHKSFFALFLGAVSALFAVWFYYDQLTALLVESTSLDLSSVCLYWWRASSRELSNIMPEPLHLLGSWTSIAMTVSPLWVAYTSYASSCLT
jgi:hypothetical protein